jgi:hypothetical protein
MVKPFSGTSSSAGTECFKKLARSLGDNAAISAEESQEKMGELEACARKEAEDQLTSKYVQTGMSSEAARIQARADLDALDGYFQAARYQPRDRIQAYTGLAVGLAKGEITLAEFRNELKELCGMRAKASGGAIGTCDKAFEKFGGRAAYIGPQGCPTSTGSPLANDVCPRSQTATRNAPMTSMNDRSHFMNWLFGKGGYDFGSSKITGGGIGGQLSTGSKATIHKNAQQAFYSIHQACKRGRSNTLTNPGTGSVGSFSINGPQAEGYFKGVGLQLCRGHNAI